MKKLNNDLTAAKKQNDCPVLMETLVNDGVVEVVFSCICCR